MYSMSYRTILPLPFAGMAEGEAFRRASRLLLDVLGDRYEDADGQDGEAFWSRCQKHVADELMRGSGPEEALDAVFPERRER